MPHEQLVLLAYTTLQTRQRMLADKQTQKGPGEFELQAVR